MTSPDSALVSALAEIVRAAVRDEIRSAVAEALDSREREAAEWLTTEEAARILRLHPKTLGRMARTHEIPATKIGNVYRYRRADVDAYLEKGGRR